MTAAIEAINQRKSRFSVTSAIMPPPRDWDRSRWRPARRRSARKPQASAHLRLHRRRHASSVRTSRPRRPAPESASLQNFCVPPTTCTVACETLKNSASDDSYCCRIVASSEPSAAITRTEASSDFPIDLARRSASSSTMTACRTPSSFSQSASSPATLPGNNVGDIGKQRKVHTSGPVFDRRQVLPDFFRSERKDRRNQAASSPRQCATSPSAHCAARGSRREGVQPVLYHIEVQRTQVGVRELVQRLVGAMKLEVVIRLAHRHIELSRPSENVLVERLHGRERHRVL